MKKYSVILFILIILTVFCFSAKENLNKQLHQAVTKANLNQVKELVGKGADINSLSEDRQGLAPLHIAAINGYKGTAEFLILNNAQINIKCKKLNRTPLHYAAIQGMKGIVELLLKDDKDYWQKKSQANKNFWDAKREKLKAKILTKAGSQKMTGSIPQTNINAKDSAGRTALHYAAVKGNKGIAEILINKKAKLNLGDENGLTALHLAVVKRNKGTVELLINNGANVNAKCSTKGMTPLHYAAVQASLGTAELLIKNRASINASDKKGDTPLHHAVMFNNKGTVELLVKYGANPYSVNKAGFTPVDFAKAKKYHQLARILTGHTKNK